MMFEEIEKHRIALMEVQTGSYNKQVDQLKEFAMKLSISTLTDATFAEGKVNILLNRIHTHLQTEYMAATCKECMDSGKTAKKACLWAFVAAVASLLAAVGSWAAIYVTVLLG